MVLPLPTVGGSGGAWGTMMNAWLSAIATRRFHAAIYEGDIQAAITAAIAAGESECIIPPGDYTIDDGLLVDTPVGFSLYAYGANVTSDDDTVAVIRAENAAGFNLFGGRWRHTTPGARVAGCDGFRCDIGTDVRIRDAEFYQTKAAGILFEQVERGWIEDCYVHDTNADGYHITNGCATIKVLRAVAEDIDDDMFAVVSYQGDSAICEDVIFQDCTGRRGHNARGMAVVGGRRITIRGGEIEKTKGPALYIAQEEGTFDTHGCDTILVDGTTLIDGNNYNTPVDQASVYITGANASFPVQNITLQRVRIPTVRYRAIRAFASVPSAVRTIRIHDPEILGPNSAGDGLIVVQDVSGLIDIQRAYGYQSQAQMIYVNNGCPGPVRIHGCTDDDGQQGVYANIGAFQYDGTGPLSVVGNTIHDPDGNRDFGVYNPAGSGQVVTGNQQGALTDSL